LSTVITILVFFTPSAGAKCSSMNPAPHVTEKTKKHKKTQKIRLAFVLRVHPREGIPHFS